MKKIFIPLSIVGIQFISANDGFIQAVLGNPSYILSDYYPAEPEKTDRSTTIQMVSEKVKFELPSCKVETDFIFKNHGPQQTVMLGFPEEGDLNSKNETGTFKYFKTFVDGKEIPVSKTNQQIYEEAGHYKQWWVRDVHFNAGQVINVKNSYQTTPGIQSLQSNVANYCTYVTETGSTWKGNIRSGHFSFDISKLPKGTFLFSGTSLKKVGNKLIHTFMNHKPTQHDNITVYWLSPDKIKLILKENTRQVKRNPRRFMEKWIDRGMGGMKCKVWR